MKLEQFSAHMYLCSTQVLETTETSLADEVGVEWVACGPRTTQHKKGWVFLTMAFFKFAADYAYYVWCCVKSSDRVHHPSFQAVEHDNWQAVQAVQPRKVNRCQTSLHSLIAKPSSSCSCSPGFPCPMQLFIFPTHSYVIRESQFIILCLKDLILCSALNPLKFSRCLKF